MKKISFYTYILTRFIGTFAPRVKLNSIKKNGTQEDADVFVDKFVSNWSRDILKKVGVRVSLKGNENIPEGGCLFVANHQGNFDFLVMMGYLNKPIGFVAKKEISKFPYFPEWMRDMHCVFIDRDNARESVKAINEATENLRNGHSMVIYPEGTRSKGSEMREFKKGSLKLAIKSGMPIVPVTLNGSYKIYEETDGKDVRAGEVTMIIDKPIYPEGLSKEEQKDLSLYVQNIIQNNLNNM